MKKLTIMLFFLVMFLASFAQAETYTVKKGDYLSKIARAFGTTWPKLFAANKDKIKNPNLIYPNQVFTIPGKVQKQEEVAAKPAKAVMTEEKPLAKAVAKEKISVKPVEVKAEKMPLDAKPATSPKLSSADVPKEKISESKVETAQQTKVVEPQTQVETKVETRPAEPAKVALQPATEEKAATVPAISTENLPVKIVKVPYEKHLAEPFYWEKPGANPFGKRDFTKAIMMFSLPDEVKKTLIAKVKAGESEWYQINNDDHFEQMIFGTFQVVDNVIAKWDPNKQEPSFMYQVDFQGKRYQLFDPRKCHNWAWRSEELPPPSSQKVEEPPKAEEPVKEPEKPMEVTKEEQPPPKVEEKPEEVKTPVIEVKAEKPPEEELPLLLIPPPPTSTPVTQKEEEKEERFVKENWDLIAGGGNYTNAHSNQNADGYYGWVKGRYRPFHFELSDSLDLNLGAFGFLAGGRGHDEDYKYKWHEWVLGPSAQLIGKGWDADLDLGLGRLYNSGHEDLYQGKQVDDIFLGSAHLNWYNRRLKGEKWFPKFELNLEYRDPFKASHEHSWNGQPLTPDPYNNKVLNLNYLQFIYDWKIGENFRLSPAFNLGAGREWGIDKNYFQFGPAIVLSHKGDDILYASIFNYKEVLGSDGDQWHPVSMSLDIGKVLKKIGRYIKDKNNSAESEPKKKEDKESNSEAVKEKPLQKKIPVATLRESTLDYGY